MPRVTRKDGIPSRVTNNPLNKPMHIAIAIAIRKAGNSGIVSVLKRVHMTTGVKPKTDPTDRSNSPDVINRVIASAMSPSSTVKVSALLMFVSDRNAGLIEVKTTSIKTRSTSGPNSGMETNFGAILTHGGKR